MFTFCSYDTMCSKVIQMPRTCLLCPDWYCLTLSVKCVCTSHQEFKSAQFESQIQMCPRKLFLLLLYRTHTKCYTSPREVFITNILKPELFSISFVFGNHVSHSLVDIVNSNWYQILQFQIIKIFLVSKDSGSKQPPDYVVSWFRFPFPHHCCSWVTILNDGTKQDQQRRVK